MTGPGQRERDPELPLVAHLIELRSRLLRCLLVFACAFLATVPFANEIYTLVAGPLLAKLPAGGAMIATEVAAPFMVPFKLCLFVALFASMPFMLYQAWAFVAPGLYDNERRFAAPLLLSSILLFYAGLAFAFFVVFPLLFGFFTTTVPAGVAIMTDIGRYLDFVLKLLFAFGIVFEVPVATVLLIRTGLVPAPALVRGRPYIIVGAFALGALLTPGPDVLSQILLAVPLWLLFEVGLFLGRRTGPAEAGDAALLNAQSKK
jgi:sec-independent protein translocase protein TatC